MEVRVESWVLATPTVVVVVECTKCLFFSIVRACALSCCEEGAAEPTRPDKLPILNAALSFVHRAGGF